MFHSLVQFITLFIIYSSLGWVFETTVCSLRAKRFVFRGFLLGPWCPIYGFSAVIILLASLPIVGSFEHPTSSQWPLVFVAAFVVATLLEWITSGALDKLYGFQLWKYKDLTIRGRVALIPSLAWGILGTILVYLINPTVWSFLGSLGQFGLYAGLVLAAAVIIDWISSVFRLNNFRRLRKRVKGDITEKYMEFATKEIRNKWLPNIRKFIISTMPNQEWLDFLAKKQKKNRRKSKKLPN